jgi:hypothetical protein
MMAMDPWCKATERSRLLPDKRAGLHDRIARATVIGRRQKPAAHK